MKNIYGVAPVATLEGDDVGFLVANLAKIKRRRQKTLERPMSGHNDG